MTIYDQCKLFKSWGQSDPNYYRVFVGAGLTAVQFKELTGENYDAEVATDENEK